MSSHPDSIYLKLIEDLRREIDTWRVTAYYLAESNPSLRENGVQAETLRWCRKMIDEIITVQPSHEAWEGDRRL